MIGDSLYFQIFLSFPLFLILNFSNPVYRFLLLVFHLVKRINIWLNFRFPKVQLLGSTSYGIDKQWFTNRFPTLHPSHKYTALVGCQTGKEWSLFLLL